jgi:hypothetical protein
MRKSFNLAVQALTVQYQGRTALNNIHVTFVLIKPNNPLINVDFPAPFGPIIPVILPEGIVKQPLPM